MELKPVSPEQVLVMFLKHHRKFTSYKDCLNNLGIGASPTTGTSYPLCEATRICHGSLHHIYDNFQELLQKFNLQNSRVNLQTILKMR